MHEDCGCVMKCDAHARYLSKVHRDVQIMPSAHKVFVEKEQLSLDVIKQYRVDVSDVAQKDAILQEYILKNADRLGQTIIFVASRRTAQALYQVHSHYACLLSIA